METTRRNFLELAGSSVALSGLGLTTLQGKARGVSVATASDRTPPRGPDEGEGPFDTMVIRGVNLVDGSGSGTRGPVDIVIKRHRIAAILSAGTPGEPLPPDRPPHNADHEIDATGMWVLPGFVNEHAHSGEGDTSRTYAYKLWLGHGVTTVRGVSLADNAAASEDKERSERNEIVAPRIVNYQTPGSAWSRGDVTTPQQGRDWVVWASEHNIDGVKFFGDGPYSHKNIIAAAIDEAKKRHLGTTMHISPPIYPELNAVEAGRLGLGTITHFYGHFESLLKEGRTHPKPPGYNYNNEQDRWRAVAQVINYSYPPGSKQWWDYLKEQASNGVTFGPTFPVYEAGRNLMQCRSFEWHARFATPSIWEYWEPSTENHGSFYYDWRTADEISWKRFYDQYMQLIYDYQSIGGRVAGGTDPGFIYNLYGFGAIRALELKQEAGFSPLEAVRSMTYEPAQTLAEPTGRPAEVGLVRPGMLADLIVAPENPLDNFKTLYGTGHARLNRETGRVERVGGVQYTVKDGIVYDAKKLLADVTDMVREQKEAGGCKGIQVNTWSAAGPCGGTGPGIPPSAHPARAAAPLPYAEARPTT